MIHQACSHIPWHVSWYGRAAMPGQILRVVSGSGLCSGGPWAFPEIPSISLDDYAPLSTGDTGRSSKGSEQPWVRGSMGLNTKGTVLVPSGLLLEILGDVLRDRVPWVGEFHGWPSRYHPTDITEVTIITVLVFHNKGRNQIVSLMSWLSTEDVDRSPAILKGSVVAMDHLDHCATSMESLDSINPHVQTTILMLAANGASQPSELFLGWITQLTGLELAILRAIPG